MDRSRLSLAPLALAALCALPTFAVEIEPRWQPGGPEGGTVRDLAFSCSDPDRVYALVIGRQDLGWPPIGHLFVSTDAGFSWEVTEGFRVSQTCEALAVDPHSADRVFAAFQGEGVFRSDDGGRTWVPARQGLPISHGSWYKRVGRLAVSRERASKLLAAVQHPGSTRDDIYLSEDRGETWIHALETRRLELLEFAPGSPEIAYTGGRQVGLLRSLDGGETWQAVGGMDGVEVSAIAFDPLDGTRLWVGGVGVYLSTDGGGTWALHTAGLDDPVEPDATARINSLAVAWGDSSRLAATSDHGSFLSTDGGATWSLLSDPAGTPAWWATRVASSPQPGGPILAGSHLFGVFRLDEVVWLPSRHGLHGVPTDILAVDPQRPEGAYAAAGIYYTSLPGLQRSTDAGHSWQDTTTLIEPYGSWGVYSVAVDPADGRHLLITTASGDGLAVSTDAGETWSLPDLPGDWPDTLAPIEFAPSDPARVYAFRSDELLASTDSGGTWQVVNDTDVGSLESQAAAVDPTDPDVLYAGLHVVVQWPWISSALAKSTDGGVTWEGSGLGLPSRPWCEWGNCPDVVERIAVDPNNRDRVLAVTQTYGLYVSEDGAASWQASTAPVLVGGVALVRDRPGTILVGGRDGGGVFISEDAGATWHPLGAGLDPAPRVLALASSADGSLVYAGTSTSVLHLHRSTPPRRVDSRLGAPPP